MGRLAQHQQEHEEREIKENKGSKRERGGSKRERDQREREKDQKERGADGVEVKVGKDKDQIQDTRNFCVVSGFKRQI